MNETADVAAVLTAPLCSERGMMSATIQPSENALSMKCLPVCYRIVVRMPAIPDHGLQWSNCRPLMVNEQASCTE